MSSDLQQGFRLGAFQVEPLRGAITGPDGESHHLEPKVMDVFVCLAGHAGELVSRDELLEATWGQRAVTDEPLTRAIGELRRALGDNRGNPTYIETVPKRGYRLIGPVELPEAGKAPGVPWRHGRPMAVGIVLGAALVLLLALDVGGLRERFRFGGASPPITSIAVLPFTNLTGDPEQEYFSAAMTDTLISELSKIAALRVISRQSVMRFKDSEEPMPEIARQLGVDAVVEGSVLHADGRVKITVQLIDGRVDRHLWAGSYDRESENVLALLGQVTSSIARRIDIAVTPEEADRLARVRTVDPEAWRLYQQGEFHRARWLPSDLELAGRYFERALQIDPDYAVAHVGVARVSMHTAFNGSIAPREAMQSARPALEEALALDNELADAHQAFGAMKFYIAWDWDQAEKSLVRALELNPSHLNGHAVYTWFLSAMGRFDEAQSTIARALIIDPLRTASNITASDMRYLSRNFDLAIEQLNRLVEMDPKSAIVRERLGWSYLQKGMVNEAIENLELARVMSPRPSEFRWVLGHAYGVAGRTAEAREVLADLHEMRKTEYVSPYGIALVYTGLGEYDDAIAWLERAYDDRNPWMPFLNVEPRWDPLRPDPRFQDLLRRMNFPAPAAQHQNP